MAKWDRKAPWVDGEALTYARWNVGSEKVWQDADTPFHKDLTFDGFQRGRSSALATFKDENGVKFSMFLTDFSDVIMRNALTGPGQLSGFFVIVKRGAYFGLRLL